MEPKRSLKQHLYRSRYFYLLAATIFQVFFASFFPDREAYLLNAIAYSVFMLALINFISHNRRIIMLFLFFAIVSVTLAWIPAQTETGQKLFALEQIIAITFLLLVIYQIINQIVRSRSVSANMILGVITIYVLFGLLAGECNQLIQFYDPAAFAGNIDPADNADIRYFSYVTITTLGYGDITPVSRLARASAVFFSLTAQIYLAVVIALIVGKFVSRPDRDGSEDN
jgi:hypothetical protein